MAERFIVVDGLDERAPWTANKMVWVIGFKQTEKPCDM
jgi:hypothetical protein